MHILKDFISIDDLETRWGLDKKQIESFTYERGDEPRLTMWYATEKRARPDGGQSAFVALPGFPWVADLLMSFPEGTNEGYGPIFSDSRADRALVC